MYDDWSLLSVKKLKMTKIGINCDNIFDDSGFWMKIITFQRGDVIFNSDKCESNVGDGTPYR